MNVTWRRWLALTGMVIGTAACGGDGVTNPPDDTPVADQISNFRGAYRMEFQLSRSCILPIQSIALDVTMQPQPGNQTSRADFPNDTGYIEVSSLGARLRFFGIPVAGTPYQALAPAEFANGSFSRVAGRSAFSGSIPMAFSLWVPGDSGQQWYCAATDNGLALTPR